MQMQKIIDYIEEHIKEDISGIQLAQIAGYSPFHFYKLFQKTVGYSVMDYVLKRKLQYALNDIGKGEKIIKIAMEYGFETHAGFTKAFKRCFGSPPQTYRMHCPLSIPRKPDLRTLRQKKVGGIVMQPKIVERATFHVGGMLFDNNIRDVSYTRDAPAFWSQRGLTNGETETRLYDILSPTKHGEYCINLKRDNDDHSFTYLFAVSIEKECQVPTDMMKLQIPSATYAVFTTPLVTTSNFVNSIKGTWAYILEEWLPHSLYEINETTFDFEYYDERCHHWLHDKINMEIYIPIQKKSEEHPLSDV